MPDRVVQSVIGGALLALLVACAEQEPLPVAQVSPIWGVWIDEAHPNRLIAVYDGSSCTVSVEIAGEESADSVSLDADVEEELCIGAGITFQAEVPLDAPLGKRKILGVDGREIPRFESRPRYSVWSDRARTPDPAGTDQAS
ncbi:hypothetical protein GCM10022221_22810 [Actinocorallia aurea]